MNRLGNALSPYLSQHADNPVDWWPWGEEALAEAKRRDVPLLISVGYAACHWCHVMAHESFEDDEVAGLMNRLTVPVKVDREEHPDVDAVYMSATQALTGQGGWPMTVFATPDGTPFFAGTYFPREHFVRLLAAVEEAWRDRRAEVVAQGAAIVEACASAGPKLADVTQSCPIDGPCPPVSPVDPELLGRTAAALVNGHDRVNGGFGRAPKFPTQPALDFLLRHHDRTGDTASLDVVADTARKMAAGGIHDRLAGGFARYSVDESWTVPHFEKMLYDNALLLDTYLDTFLATGDEFFAGVADGIARFIVDDLGLDGGGFASALDADTGGVEGATYVWTRDQLRQVLGVADGDWAAELFGATDTGNFEHGRNVLRLDTPPGDTDRYADVTARLRTARNTRPQPDRDDKLVAVWNGLSIVSLTRYAAERDADWADTAADRAARRLRDLHLVAGRLRRVSRNGKVSDAPGTLEDYAAVAAAFLARSTGRDEWLAAAIALTDVIREHFTDEIGNLHDTADDAQALAWRPADPSDGPTPSGTALAVDALRRMRTATGDETYQDDAWRALAATAPVIESHGRFASGLATVAERMVV